MREQLLALEKKLRDNIYEFAKENSDKSVVGVGICLGVYSTFNQKDVDWLNSITDHWEMYKYCISFSFIAENNQELENVLLHCVEYF